MNDSSVSLVIEIIMSCMFVGMLIFSMVLSILILI